MLPKKIESTMPYPWNSAIPPKRRSYRGSSIFGVSPCRQDDGSKIVVSAASGPEDPLAAFR
jgi:hypothetical protein